MRPLQITRKDTGGEWGVLFLAVATPPAGRDQAGPYPRGQRCARLAPAIRHQYPNGWRAPLDGLLYCYNHGIDKEVGGLRLTIGIGAAEGECNWLSFEGR